MKALCAPMLFEHSAQCSAFMEDRQRVVLHLDCDSFFVQVEVLRDPTLQGRPLAIQQHQDIIAANHLAKQAGVKKHMAPAEARAVLAGVGGRVVHVFCEEGRVSYRPYRETSAAIMRLLKKLPAAAVVEKASIDEAFILLHSAPCRPGEQVCLQQKMQQGQQVAQEVRAAVKQELGITMSVGVSFNKLLAKLASKKAKPDGIHCIPPDDQAIRDHMANTTVDQLPGFGGRVSSTLAAQGVTTCSALAALLRTDPRRLDQLGLPPAKAALLARYCQGDDNSEVVDKGPPRSFQVQMTLTPVPIPASPSVNPALNPTTGKQEGVTALLQPLAVRGPDTRSRMSHLLHHMCRDLVSRVILDRHQEGRWPSKLVVQLTCQTPNHTGPAGSGPTSNSISRTTAFPSAALMEGQARPKQGTAEQPLPHHGSTHPGSPHNRPAISTSGSSFQGTGLKQGVGAGLMVANPQLVVSERLYDVPSSTDAGGAAQTDASTAATMAVLQAVHAVAESVAGAMLQQPAQGWVVTQVALAASALVPWEQANAPSITRFLKPPASPKVPDKPVLEPLVSEEAVPVKPPRDASKALVAPPERRAEQNTTKKRRLGEPGEQRAAGVGSMAPLKQPDHQADNKVQLSSVFDALSGTCGIGEEEGLALAQTKLDMVLAASGRQPVFMSAWKHRAATAAVQGVGS